MLGQQQAESRDHASQQHLPEKREEAVAPVGEPVPVAGLDSRRAQRGVEQRVHRLAEFGLDVIRAAGGPFDVEGDDGSLMSPGPAQQTAPGELPARQRRGGERFQFRGDRVQAELLTHRHEDVQGLPGFALLFRLREEPYRLHVVQPVGQLHRDDPGVGGFHGCYHPRHLASPPLEVIQRHGSGHHRRDVLPEFAAQRGKRVRGVLHGVMEQGRAQGPVIGAEPGKDRRHAHRMGDVRVAAAPELTSVASRRDIVGPPKKVHIGIGPGGPEGLAQRCDRIGCRAWGSRRVAVHSDAPCLPVVATRLGHASSRMSPASTLRRGRGARGRWRR